MNSLHPINLQRRFFLFAAIFGATGVALGALGAHFLKTKMEQGLLTPENIQTFETAVRYQVYHAFALLFVGLLYDKMPAKWLNRSGYLFIAGVFLFSGSLYLLSTRTLIGLDTWKWLGPITPLGGLCFIMGWVGLFISFWHKN